MKQQAAGFGESVISPDLKTTSEARAFPLRHSEDDEVKPVGISLACVPK